MSGRGTAGGIVFQAEVGAYVAGLLLAERPLSRIGSGLPGNPTRLTFETPEAVDDLLIENDDGGAIYIQAKRTITLSTQPNSELASVAAQFIQQHRAGTATHGNNRSLDPSRDRLILAVGATTATTVRDDLREALDRNRTGAATALPKALRHALEAFSAHIDSAWLAATGNPIDVTERHLVLALCSVVAVGDHQRQIVEEALSSIVAVAGEESLLVDNLITWAATASANGTGGDSSTIRLSLGRSPALRERPTFQADAERLRKYSASISARLARFTQIAVPEGDISINRPVAAAVAAAAVDGSLAITGEPGAGKSAIVHSTAAILASSATVVLLAVDSSATSLEALRVEIGLEHQIVDVLAAMAGDGRPAYLILDALDAARGGAADAAYKRLVEQISALPNWRIVASVRTFDLRLGKDWRRLLAGPPPNPAYCDPTFAAVRHIHVGLLDDSERAEIGSKSPSLAAAIAAGGLRMAALSRNPFNLALLGDLLRSGVTASSLSSVSTRGELLARYWDERIGDFGLPAIASLKALVDRMLNARAIDLPETAVPDTSAGMIDELQRVGVLVTETSRRIGFRHHVLFDYSVAKLILLPDENASLSYLNKEKASGLLVTPSLGYWWEALKSRKTRTEFWNFAIRLIGTDNTDPIVRVETARLSVESVAAGEDLAPLASEVQKAGPLGAAALRQIVGSLATKSHNKQPIDADTWARFAAELGVPSIDRLASMRALISILLENNPTSEGLAHLGLASRSLFDAMSGDHSRIPWLAPTVVTFVAKTFGTDPAASKTRLRQLFEPDRFAKFGYVEVPWLAHESLSICAHDADFTAELFYRVFKGGDFRRDHVTSMSNSWILGLNSNAAQDFAMSMHSLSTTFPTMIDQHPVTALRSFAAALRGERERSHAPREPEPTYTVTVADVVRNFEEDQSHIWAHDADGDEHDDYAKLYRSVIEWARATNAPGTVIQIPDLILGETTMAFAWRVVFEIATIQPSVLGTSVFPASSSSAVLNSRDTRQSAIRAIAAAYPYLDRNKRIAAEKEWLSWDFATAPNPEKARIWVVATLLEAIGEENLLTDEARAFLAETKKAGSSLENSKPFGFSMRRGDSAGWVDDEEGSEKHPLLVLSQDVRAAFKALKDSKSPEHGRSLWAALSTLIAGLAEAGSVEPSVDAEVSDALAEGIGIALAGDWVPDDQRDNMIARLLTLSQHADPSVDLEKDVEESFAESPVWGTPAPRIRAAEAIAILACNPKFWPLVRTRFEELLFNDPHPAVRYTTVWFLRWLGSVDSNALWAYVERFVASEKNLSVIKHAVSTLSRLAGRDAARLEPLILPLAEKKLPKRGGDDPFVGVITFWAIQQDLKASRDLLSLWVQDYTKNEERLHSALFDIRANLLAGLGDADTTKAQLRSRTRHFLNSLIDALEPAVRSWPQSGNEPTETEIVALKLFNEIGDQIYYAVGHDKIDPALDSIDAKRQFLLEYAPLISKLTTLGTPRTVHYLLSVISMVNVADPEVCFDLFSEAMLRTSGVDRYEHEPMGAKLFVDLVGLYLADYRYIFDDEKRRLKLVDCLAVFVEAGWPEARKLFQNLPELLQ